MVNAYTIMMAFVLLLGLFMHGEQPGNKKYIWISCLLMFCLLGLRDVTVIGNDTRSSYLWNFHRLANSTLTSMLQTYKIDNNPCYYLFAKLMNMLTHDDYQMYIIITAALMLIVYAHFITRYSTSPIQSFCYFWGLLLFLFIFSGLKQSFAMTILLLAFDAVVDRKPIRFILLVLIASQFHFPALIFMPAYWVAKMHPGRYFIVLLAGMLVLTYLFRDQLLTIMMRAYEDDTGEQTYSLAGSRFLSTKALIMLVIVVAALILRRPTPEDRVYSILVEFVAISIVLQTFCAYSNIFERLADYYFQFSVLLIPMVFERTENAESLLPPDLDDTVKRIAPYLFSGFGVWRYANIIQADAGHFLPFKFFFQ